MITSVLCLIIPGSGPVLNTGFGDSIIVGLEIGEIDVESLGTSDGVRGG